MPQSKNSKDIDEQIEDSARTDMSGQMAISNWSCLVLDVADKLAPMLGKRGMELYYRAAQAWEAKETGWEGEEEAKFTAIMALYYVNLSLNSFIDIHEKFGVVVEMPPYPEDEPWTNLDAYFAVYAMIGPQHIAIDAIWPYLDLDKIDQDAWFFISINLIYQLENHPEYGTRSIAVAEIKTHSIEAVYYSADLNSKTPAERLQIAQDIVEDRFTAFPYVRVG